jgi:hypothetical protein
MEVPLLMNVQRIKREVQVLLEVGVHVALSRCQVGNSSVIETLMVFCRIRCASFVLSRASRSMVCSGPKTMETWTFTHVWGSSQLVGEALRMCTASKEGAPRLAETEVQEQVSRWQKDGAQVHI